MVAMEYFDYEAVFKDGSGGNSTINSTVAPRLLDGEDQLNSLRALVSRISYHMSSLYVLMVVIMLCVILVLIVQISFALYTLIKKKKPESRPSQLVVGPVKKKIESKKKEKKTDRGKKELFSPGKTRPYKETKINVDFEEMDKGVTTALPPHSQSILEALSNLAAAIFSNSEQSQKTISTPTATAVASPSLAVAIPGQTPYSSTK